LGQVVVGSVDGTVRTYDVRMGKMVEDVIAGESGPLFCLPLPPF
jgi:hypothetical protein